MKTTGPKSLVSQTRLPKCPTGIQGLDEITGGGLPRGRPTLVCGGAGCGKTLLAAEFLVRGAVQFNEPGVFMSFEETEGELVVSLVDLVKVFSQILERRKEVPKFELHHDTVTIAQMMDRLRQRLVGTDEAVSLIEFFESCTTRNAMIVALLAVLEMVRMQAVLLVQSDLFADIRLLKHKMFDAVFAGPDAMSQIEEHYL